MVRERGPSVLANAAAVSDQIRRISEQAFAMQLHATNATITTRSRGVTVPGFETVAQQMGALSRELTACLARLRAATVQLLRALCTEVARRREVALLAHAMSRTAVAARAVAPILARLRARADDDPRMRRALRAFGDILDDARQLAATGCVLARTAKLEATDGGALAPLLADVAGEFAELADAVDQAVRTIARKAADLEG